MLIGGSRKDMAGGTFSFPHFLDAEVGLSSAFASFSVILIW